MRVSQDLEHGSECDGEGTAGPEGILMDQEVQDLLNQEVQEILNQEVQEEHLQAGAFQHSLQTLTDEVPQRDEDGGGGSCPSRGTPSLGEELLPTVGREERVLDLSRGGELGDGGFAETFHGRVRRPAVVGLDQA